MKKTIVYLSSAALVLVLVVLYMFFVKSDDSMLSSSETDSLIAQKQKEIETFKADITTKSDELQTLRELVKKLQSDISTAETKILELNSLGTKELQIQIETLKLDIEAKSKNLELLIKESENYKKAQNTAYTMLISTFSTTYNNSDSARSTNISNATRSISGRIVMPNEEFSFINIIGECTAPKGYVESKVFYKGELTQGMGGGVCQVSTTLFNTALLANLQISERHGHSQRVSYIPAGRDATVNYGTLDLKFINSYKCPIKIIGEAFEGKITFSIYAKVNSCEIPNVTVDVSEISAKSFKTSRLVDGVMNYFTNTVYQ